MPCIGIWCEHNNDSLLENPDQDADFAMSPAVVEFFGGGNGGLGVARRFCPGCVTELNASCTGLILKGQQQMMTHAQLVARHDAFQQAALSTNPTEDPVAVAAFAKAVADAAVGKIP